MYDLFCFRTLTVPQQNQQSEFRGFTCGTEEDTEQFDLPEQLSTQLTRWSTKIYLALTKASTFTPGGPSSKLIQSNLYTDGYTLLLKIIRHDIPTYSDYPATLLGARPVHEPGETIQQYFDRTIGWLKLRAKVMNESDNLNTKEEMDLLINGLYSSKGYFSHTHTDRQSTIDSIRAKYQQNSIVGTLDSLSTLIGTPAQSPIPRQRAPAPSTPSSLNSPMACVAFPKTGNYPSASTKRKPHGKRLSYNVVSIRFTLEASLADLVVPDNCSAETTTYVNNVKVYLNTLTNTRNPGRIKHNTSRPCAVCKEKGHDFQGCKPLQDNEFLRDAVIKSSLFFSNKAKRQAALVKASLERQKSALTSRIHQLETTADHINAMYSDSNLSTCNRKCYKS